MSQQVLLFFSKLLSQVQKPLLQLVNVYRPVQVNQVEHLQHTAEAHLYLFKSVLTRLTATRTQQEV